jgi:hypothetical protein
MALIKRQTPEEKEAERAAKAQHQEAQRLDKMRQEFARSPAGQARTAYERGDNVFQYSLDVRHTQAIVIPMFGATNTHTTTDPSVILNSVCAEGWELVNGSFVFLELGQESRDKFLASGQNIAVRGTIIGYYLFKRCEANHVDSTDPWQT